MTKIDTSTEAVEALLKDMTEGPWEAALERALKYNTAMHGCAAAYNQYIIDAITELNPDAR